MCLTFISDSHLGWCEKALVMSLIQLKLLYKEMRYLLSLRAIRERKMVDSVSMVTESHWIDVKTHLRVNIEENWERYTFREANCYRHSIPICTAGEPGDHSPC